MKLQQPREMINWISGKFLQFLHACMHVGVILNHLQFFLCSEFPVWNWLHDYPIDDVIVEVAPLAQCDSSCSLFPPDNLIMQGSSNGIINLSNYLH